MSHTVLLVDDEPFNLELLAEQLEDAGYRTVTSGSGEDAWRRLNEDGASYSAVLLDKMMPGLCGVELLRRIKDTPRLECLPVVLQTAVSSAASVQAGLAAGAFYYLSKPFTREMLLAAVGAAVGHRDRLAHLKARSEQQVDALQHLADARFTLRTHDEAQQLAALLAHACPQPGRVATGLFELLVNAIEHGNLELSFEEKARRQDEGTWEAELEKRLAEPVRGVRRVTLAFERLADRLRFTVSDEGRSFCWQARQGEGEACGRGLLIAERLAFDALEYRDKGNSVEATVFLAAD
ncbi:response regulator [Crenobacter cavernae]|uniref:Response regulator n=1 Tax=Crenobacter cavernae TaxID=2290923 RepID=A0A345Y5I9_9NEIS|nr:response regulator [Crenobacter cavernae]AXK39191.1 response regulator [Crenobacter cavernae]